MLDEHVRRHRTGPGSGSSAAGRGPGRASVGRVGVVNEDGSHGFTLTELAVVIAILGVLMVILMPSLSGSLRLARRAICKSNLRQLGSAFQAAAQRRDGDLEAMAYPDPARFPSIPYNIVPHDRLFVCPEDAPGQAALPAGLKYRACWQGYYTLEFADGATAPNGQVCCRSRRGQDERGSYTEFVFEENFNQEIGCDFMDRRPPEQRIGDHSDRDGLFRIYDSIPGRGRVLRLHYYTCPIDNQAWLYDQGLFEPSGRLYGHAGEEIELGSMYSSYGINARIHRHQVAPGAIVLLDYERGADDEGFVADPDSPDIASRLRLSARHLGRLNVLLADQSVRTVRPEDISPAANAGAWSP